MELRFRGELWEWRGPAPYHFVTVPETESAAIDTVAEMVSYGWGMIPVTATIHRTEWTTSLWPKNGVYIVPIKDVVRRAESLQLGEAVDIRLVVAI